MTKKNKKHIVIATAIIILVVALLIYRYYIPDMKSKKQFTPASVEYTYDDSVTSSQLAEYNARQDWQLTLVNNDTPICDNCSVILTALDNGQAVDCRIYPQLQKMFDDARSQGIYPTITSSFRTAKDQQDILERRKHMRKNGWRCPAQANTSLVCASISQAVTAELQIRKYGIGSPKTATNMAL